MTTDDNRHMMKQTEIKNIWDILAYCERQEWYLSLKDVPQDPIWHSEGNVLTHTDMVVKALWEDKDFKDLPVCSQRNLTWAACLHDYGKKFCTEEIDGRIRSHGHSKMSFKLAPRILHGIRGLSTRDRLQILNLVRYHGRPYWFMSDRTNPIPEMSITVLSNLVNIDMLYLLAKADFFGRQSLEKSDDINLTTLDLFKDTAQELNCWRGIYQFANSTQFRLAYNGNLSTFEYIPYEDFNARVVMLSGLPGAGKDTWLETNKHNYYVLSLDDIRTEMGVKPTDNQGTVIQEARRRYKEQLAAGNTIFLNATNLTRNMRSKWLGIAEDYNAHTTIRYIEPASLPIIYTRNKDRHDAVPENVWMKMLNNLEIPQQYEANLVMLNSLRNE